MPKYSVLGIYDSTGKIRKEEVIAMSPHLAMQRFSEEAASRGEEDDLQVIGAFRGLVNLTLACEESGKAAYACDLAIVPED